MSACREKTFNNQKVTLTNVMPLKFLCVCLSLL